MLTRYPFWGCVVVGLTYASIFALLLVDRCAYGGIVRERAVGGIVVDAKGVLRQPPTSNQVGLRREIVEGLHLAPDELAQPAELRKISLKRLQAAIHESLEDGADALPQEILFLAGIQRIQYILVYPEQNDIVLAGPGEGWTVGENAEVVGKSTGRPVLKIEDLLVAMRTVRAARHEGITVSINPRPEGLKRLQAYMRTQKQFDRQVLPVIERVLGPQDISITGVPPSSHFARILVSADHRMKRIAMGLDESPVKQLTSYLALVRSARAARNISPRWWLACDYEPLARGESGLAWEIRGPGVKCLTENAVLDSDGTVVQAGQQKNLAAERWAQMMTDQYQRLAEKDVVFSQLQNIMDMCVFAALMQHEGLAEKAGCDISLLAGFESSLKTDHWNAPKTISTQASVVKRGRRYVITASGGVDIDSWAVATTSEPDVKVEDVRSTAGAPADASHWWWN